MKQYLITYSGLGATFKTDLNAENETAVRIYFKKFFPSARIVTIKEQNMAHQFIVVTSQNKAKNQVQTMVQQALSSLDQTIYSSLNHARKEIENRFIKTVQQYTGRAVLPVLKSFKPTNDTFQWYIEDVIYITVYTVKNRLE